MPEAATRAHDQRAVLTRWLVAVLGCVLLLPLSGDAPTRAAADLGSQISAARRSQIYHESVMRHQDRQLQRLGRAHKTTRKALRQVKRHLKDVKSRRATARRRVATRTERLDHIRARWPEDAEEEPPELYLERLAQAEVALAEAKRSLRRVERRVARVDRTRKTRQRRLASIRRQTRQVVRRQNAAEASLGAQIVWMTRLAQQRALRQTAIRLGPGGEAFAWPAAGSITQRYGCTGFRLNPRRGSCRHFHDGLDMSPNGGTAIRAVADGVVAYVGWNPWDSEGRAFIIVIGHRDGFHSRYGHLRADRRVRVGQMVRKGEVIGRMGSTGKSTGVHLHVELLDRSGPVDPLDYLPARERDQERRGSSSARGRDDGRAGAKRSGKATGGSKAKGRQGKASGKRRAGAGKKAKAEGRRDAGGQSALDPDPDRDGSTAPWILPWPEPCEERSEPLRGARSRIDVAGQVDGSALQLPWVAGTDCEVEPFDGRLMLTWPSDADAADAEVAGRAGDPRAGRRVE